jgi:L-seryl-tRNA(Ser) seleniumtransferase
MANLRDLPQVDALARDARLSVFPPQIALVSARTAVAEARQRARNGEPVDRHTVLEEALAHAATMHRPGPAHLINMSGVVLHTGLGRARLAPAVAARVAEVARAHSAVEFDLETGARGDRQEHVRWLLRELTGAEDAHVVNNCAGAVTLSLAALAAGREVILSRGQMIEIGGSFRLPEIIAASGCRLVETGCTNKTRLSDYEGNIGPGTAAILRCHPSNYAIVGFTEFPGARELAELARRHDVPLIDDAGSGCLLDTTRFGLPKEPTVQEAVRAGASLVLFSGDKLLGGPQAGIIVGSTQCVAHIRQHPLARALRVDKLTLAALEATLRLYLVGRELEIPVWRYLSRGLDEVRRMARRLARAYPGATVARGQTEAGGGSLPGSSVPTWRIRLPHHSPDRLLHSLRASPHGIVGRVEDGAAWLDPRTLDGIEATQVERSLREVSPPDGP